jgi:hypothetical protein
MGLGDVVEGAARSRFVARLQVSDTNGTQSPNAATPGGLGSDALAVNGPATNGSTRGNAGGATPQALPGGRSDKPGKGVFGWLGRQVGYVTRAIRTDVGGPKVVYRENQVLEAEHPDDPTLKLRRTVIDEVIQDK